MKIIEKWEDALGGVLYTVELDAEKDVAVTIKVSTQSNAAYTMQNHDGSVAHGYHYGGSYPNYPYNEPAAMKLVAEAYENDYGRKMVPPTAIHICCNELAIEVTRRCNMACEHCLRGEAQNIDINDDILERVAGLITGTSVLFTGGEPSLNVGAINRYFELAEENDTLPGAFYVVTNGLANQEELAIALLKAYAKMDERECCGVTVSRDIFHEVFRDKYAESDILEGLSFYSATDKSHDIGGNDNLDWVMNLGRALENGIGNDNPWRGIPTINHSLDELVNDYWIDRNGELNVEFTEMLYISANGNVVNICDVEYDRIDAEPICHINELPALLADYVARQSHFRHSALSALTAPQVRT